MLADHVTFGPYGRRVSEVVVAPATAVSLSWNLETITRTTTLAIWQTGTSPPCQRQAHVFRENRHATDADDISGTAIASPTTWLQNSGRLGESGIARGEPHDGLPFQDMTDQAH